MSTTEPVAVEPNDRVALIGKAGIGAISLLAANAGLLFIYLALDLTLYQLVMVYWWECVWIGLFSALKLIVISAVGEPYENRLVEMSRGSNIVFSIILIVSVSSVFFGLLGLLGLTIISATEVFALSNRADDSINQIGLVLTSSILFLIGHGISFVTNFLVLGEFRHARVGGLLILPFKRCFALLATIGVAFLVAYNVPGLATTSGFAVVVIVVKLLWDHWLHRRERRMLATG